MLVKLLKNIDYLRFFLLRFLLSFVRRLRRSFSEP